MVCDVMAMSKVIITLKETDSSTKVPKKLTKTLAQYTITMQVAGNDKASHPKILATVEALMMNIKWEGIFAEQVWCNTRRDHLVLLNSTTTKNNEDRHVDWLIFKDKHDWMDATKKWLTRIVMVKNEPGIINIYHLRIIYFNYSSISQ